MKINDRLSGFLIKEMHEIEGLSARLFVMEHERCGARLIYLDRDDENKTFSVAFKTLPKDSTGVFHILEHSVLCGSEKYRLKDPFVELLSGSLNTFLNAMTFADKTMYPVSSTSEKEFLSLADVYLDAVFNPLAVRSEEAFMQEGWHYEPAEDGSLSYKGVVLNEMRGDYSSPESVTDRHIKEMLFEGTPYAHDSGGDPSEITSLTFEDFCLAHKTYYHPSNATFFLDGSMDVLAPLALIDSYISGYERKSLLGEEYSFTPAMRRKTSREVEYEISESESIENKTRLAIAHLTFRFDEREKIFGAAILSSALLSSNESEIKREILRSGLCEDLQINVGEGIFENYYEVDFINVKDSCETEVEDLFYSTVLKVSERGIDKGQLVAAINSLEFSLRERDYGTLPLGIVYAMNIMESYLYSDDALSGITFENEIKMLRNNLETGFFEALLKEIFIDNESKVRLLMHPSTDLGERQREEEEKRLSSVREALTEDEWEEIVRKNEALLLWQNTEDTEEARSSIPRLRASDIQREIKTIPTELTDYSGATLLTIPIATSGIAYTELYFDVSDISEDEIFTSALLGLFLGNLATESYTAPELMKALKSDIGTFSSALKTVTRTDGVTKIYYKFFLSALSSKKERARELLSEVALKTLFDDAVAMENIVRQAYIASEESYASAGHRAAKSRASAMLYTDAAVLEYYSGYEAHLKFKALVKDFEKRLPALREELLAFISKYLVRERLTVSLAENASGESEDFMRSVADLFEGSGAYTEPECKIKTLPKRKEGIRIPAKVSFSSLVAKTEPEDVCELGRSLVASGIVSYEYLWSEIRVKGGAYGAGMSALRTGQTSFYSYRDPTPKKSIEKMLLAPDFLRERISSGAEIDKYIIGAIGDTSPYLTPRARAGIGVQRHLARLTDEMRALTRLEILSMDKEKLSAFAKKLSTGMENAAFCIVAPKDKLEECELDAILEI